MDVDSFLDCSAQDFLTLSTRSDASILSGLSCHGEDITPERFGEGIPSALSLMMRFLQNAMVLERLQVRLVRKLRQLGLMMEILQLDLVGGHLQFRAAGVF